MNPAYFAAYGKLHKFSHVQQKLRTLQALAEMRAGSARYVCQPSSCSVSSPCTLRRVGRQMTCRKRNRWVKDSDSAAESARHSFRFARQFHRVCRPPEADRQVRRFRTAPVAARRHAKHIAGRSAVRRISSLYSRRARSDTLEESITSTTLCPCCTVYADEPTGQERPSPTGTHRISPTSSLPAAIAGFAFISARTLMPNLRAIR